MRIVAAEQALPQHRYDQSQILAAIAAHWGETLHNPRRLEQLFSNVRVSERCLALPIERYAELESFSASNAAFIEAAVALGGRALAKACTAADVAPSALDQLLFVTSTGVATPSIDARLVGHLGLDPGIRRTPIFGLGCMAGAGGVARLADLLRAHPDQLGAVVSVELCSLTLQRADLSIANMISSGLFGDGAAAVLMAGADHQLARKSAGPSVADSRSMLYPDSEDVMGWEIGTQGFRVVLSADVPAMVRRYLRRDVNAFLTAHELELSEMAAIVAHPGGPRVLEAIQEALELPREALARSWASLEKVGNLSSASVLSILADTMHGPPIAEGSHGLLLAMGPGFCSEMVLLRW